MRKLRIGQLYHEVCVCQVLDESCLNRLIHPIELVHPEVCLWTTRRTKCRESAISRKRSSRSCDRWTCWFRRDKELLTRFARSASPKSRIIGGVRNLAG